MASTITVPAPAIYPPTISANQIAIATAASADIVALQASGSQYTDEWTDPAAAATAGLKAATATTVAIQTVLPAGLLAPGIAALLAYPRNVTFTTAGGTAADAPATVVVNGTDVNDAVLAETITLAQTATIATGVKAFKTITSIVYAAGDGTGGTIAIGFGQVFGFTKKIKSRAGRPAVAVETAAGSLVTTGTYASAATSPPNGSYSPSTAPNAANDYAVQYERDFS